MSKKIYKWKRFWCPRDTQIDLSDQGYLVDPDSEYGKHANPKLVGMEAIADIPCLVLLGEPGIGKSQEITNLANYTEEQLNPSHLPLKIDLRSCSSLKADLIQDQDFINWVDGEHRLYLFLDSLDEGLLEIRNLATQLVDEFSKQKYRDKLNRLYLRIACRTTVFPKVLEEGLEKLWEKDLRIYKLTQLRQVDVEIAVTEHSLDADAFLREVNLKSIVPFAIKPICLEFLIKIFQENQQQFPANQRLVDLYEKGCRYLCKEHNLNRIASHQDENLDEDERFIIAARIAAIMVFCLRPTVWTSPCSGNDPDKDVLIKEFCLGNENAHGRPLLVTESVIREVLDSGLFSSRDDNRIGWAHQTYAEFLAAWYLTQHTFRLPRISGLIIHYDGRVVHQLRETTAWLANLMPEVFQKVMEIDPYVLLQSDMSTVDDGNKSKLVELLLKLLNEESFGYFWCRYNKLNHAGLADQLESYICDTTKSELSRLVAIHIAQDCDVKSVQNTLANIALDPNQPYAVRTHAARVICAMGDEETKARLKPLAFGEVGDDLGDDLKGYGLRAIWSQHITIEELLSYLTPPTQRESIPCIGGVYQDFIATELAEHLQLCDLPVILRWLEKLPARYDLPYPYGELADSVMLKARQHLEKPDVRIAFAKLTILKLKRAEGGWSLLPQIFPCNSSDNPCDDADEQRRQLITTFVSLLSESEDYFLWLKDTLYPKDISWIIDNITSTKSDKAANIWVKLLREALTWENTKHIDAILEACNMSPFIRTEFEVDITPIELDSEKARQAKANYLETQSQPHQSIFELLHSQSLLAKLEIVESGQPHLWWQIVIEMAQLTNASYSNHHVFEPDITKLQGWKAAEADIRARIIKTAKDYLNAGNPETKAWIGTNNFFHSAIAGYQALCLLVKQEPEFISIISPDTWTKWIASILKLISVSRMSRVIQDEIFRKIVKVAYQNIPDEFIETLIILMIQNNYQPRTHYTHDLYRSIKEILGQYLASLILDRITDKNLTTGLLEVLLTDLFIEDVYKAKEVAKTFIPKIIPESGEGRNKAIIATRLMLTNYVDNDSWLVFWSATQQDYPFRKEILKYIASTSVYEGQIEEKIKEDYLADLYIFLTQQYPEIEQPKPKIQEPGSLEFQELGESDSIRKWRNNIPQCLQARGTPEACDALEKIIRELPEKQEQLQAILLKTKDLVHYKNWKPPKPEDLLQIILHQEKRLVRDGYELLNVLIESLERLEFDLHKETPAVMSLWNTWNECGEKSYKPKDENEFSDYVKNFLDNDLKLRGIIVNREVEIRPNNGGKTGERTDIHVNAISKHTNSTLYDTVTVIIEVKGCWHPALKTAMKTQLVDRYLTDNTCKYGLYLIGWFNCQQWSDNDSRKKGVPKKMTLNEAKEQFAQQAQELSSSGKFVKVFVLDTALRSPHGGNNYANIVHIAG